MTTLATPTTTEIAANIVAQLEGSIAQTIPMLPRAFCRVLAKALAGVFVLLWKYSSWSLLQQFVAYASASDTVINGTIVNPLTELGRLFGVGDPIAATRAEHTITVTVKVQTGSLPAQSQLLYANTGVVYTTTAAVALNAATVQVTMRAASDQGGGGGVGSIGNLEAGDVVSFANPLANVATAATVVSRTVDGADAETPDAYRARVLRRVQQKPQGGAYADYRAWGEELAGVVNIYPYTSATPGEVDVYVEATPASSGDPDGIPTAGQLDAVAALIEADSSGLASRRPASAAVNVLPITRAVVDVTVTGLDSDDDAATETLIEEALEEYMLTREPFIVGLSVLPRLDRITRAAVSGIVDDAASSVGGSITSVTLGISGSPINAVTLSAGQKAKLGTVTFA
jgi:uncharacterized phage protein gp47/JayE